MKTVNGMTIASKTEWWVRRQQWCNYTYKVTQLTTMTASWWLWYVDRRVSGGGNLGIFFGEDGNLKNLILQIKT